jgi:hypothetical protein
MGKMKERKKYRHKGGKKYKLKDIRRQGMREGKENHEI